ncbi:MAG: aldehyde dehydrogenase [Chitinophagaceae bacterium]
MTISNNNFPLKAANNTTPQNFSSIGNEMITNYYEGNTQSLAFRKAMLLKLKQLIELFENDIIEALYEDLHKSAAEAYTTEIAFLYKEIDHTIAHLWEWMQPETVNTPLILQPGSSKIYKDALGLVLIVAPWNYPFQLAIAPLIGAIAGGNCAIVKPSELAPNTADLVTKIINANFPKNYIRSVEGNGAEVIPAMLNNINFNHIFFTGSTNIGKQIAKIAAEKLVPVTLELGGKSPCIVTNSANIQVAAKRIVWGKFTNAGQTCVAPDYIVVAEEKKEELLQAIKKNIQIFYGDNSQQSADYGRIIHKRHFQNLKHLITESTILMGGKMDEGDLWIEPTIVSATWNSKIMEDEIFGPILPIITFKHIAEVYLQIKQLPQPLSAYIFTESNQEKNYFIQNLSFGGGCINNTLMHLGNPDLPFGGVGFSGIGQYHGKYSFDAFTRPKAIYDSATWVDPSIKYPPYAKKFTYLKMMLKNL